MIFSWRKASAIVAWLLFLLSVSAAAQTPSAAAPGVAAAPPPRQASPAGHKRGKSKPSPAPAQPTPPPPPLTPEQMPPTPPQVTYANGLLTIVASNSTLSDVLRAVSARTGATVDAPAPLTGERVAVSLGPAPPREVLSELLTGPRIDYILLGADGDPNAVRSIILSPAQSSSGTSMAMARPQPAPMPPPEEADDEDDQPTPEVQQPVRPIQQPSPGRRPFMQPQPPDQMAQPMQPQTPDQAAPPAPPGEGGGPQQPIKTPEQLLQQLRRMQQQGSPQPPPQPQQQ